METLCRPAITIFCNFKSFSVKGHLLNIQFHIVVVGRPSTKHTVKPNTDKITPDFLLGRITKFCGDICSSISLHYHVHEAGLLIINNELHLTEWNIAHSRKLTGSYLAIVRRGESFIALVDASPLAFASCIIKAKIPADSKSIIGSLDTACRSNTV